MNFKSEESYFTNDKEETMELGKKVLNLLKEMEINLIILRGEYGSGKTTFAKGIAKGLNIKDNIKSPSFNKKFVYDNLVHYDLYNVNLNEIEKYKEQILEDLEFNNVVVEWGNNLLLKKYKKVFEKYVDIEIINMGESERKFILKFITK